MSLKKFDIELKRGFKSPSYLFSSDEQFILKEALFEIRKTIPPSQLEFSYHVFDASEAGLSLDEIVTILNTTSFFGGRKVVAIENTQKLKEKDVNILEEYMAKPSPDSLLVMLYITEKGKLKQSHKDRFKDAHALKMDFRDSEMPEWISFKAGSMGFSITRDAVDCLIGLVGAEIGLITPELDKLSRTGKKRIELKDVEEIVTGFGDYNAMKLADAILSKDANKAFAIYASIANSNAPEMILGAMNYKLSMMPGKDTKYMRAALKILHETDVAIKSSRGGFHLENMFYRLMKL